MAKPGDVIVGGKNFGCGSSREHAPICIKESGLQCVVAESFARIFFRNCINVGLAPIQCDTDAIDEGDELEVDLVAGEVRDLTNGKTLPFAPLPPVMRSILDQGGLVAYVQEHGDLEI